MRLFRIYTKHPGEGECPYCDKAKKLISSRGHAFTDIPLGVADRKKRYYTASQEANRKITTVPVIYEHDGGDKWSLIGGYNELAKSYGAKR